MDATTQATLTTYVDKHVQDKSLLQALKEIIDTYGSWRGTATQLQSLLHTNLSPRDLSLELDKISDELVERYNIYFTRKRIRGQRIISLAFAPNNVSTTTMHRHPYQTLDKMGDADPLEVIRFPFTWAYASITELSSAEKEVVNQVRHKGRKRYHKICGLCGNGSNLEFRKDSDGNSCLICRACAIRYVESARTIKQREVVQ